MLSLLTNKSALAALPRQQKAAVAGDVASQRLSSGLRVNSAKDDAAGLAIATRMNSQLRGLQMAQRNLAEGVSIAQIADGALGSATETLQRLRELAVQAKTGTLKDTDRAVLNEAFSQQFEELSRVLQGTQFNGRQVLGAGAGAMVFQAGAGNTATDSLSVTTTNLVAALSLAEGGGAVEPPAPVAPLPPPEPVILESTSGPSGTLVAATGWNAHYVMTLESGGQSVQVVSSYGPGSSTFNVARFNTLFNSSARTGVTNAGYTVTGSAGTGDLAFARADGASFTVKVVSTYPPGKGFTNFPTGSTVSTPVFAPVEEPPPPSPPPPVAEEGEGGWRIDTVANATAALTAIDGALALVAKERALYGALQSRLASATDTLNVTTLNIEGALGRTLDANFAEETLKLAKVQVLQQAGLSVMAQAKQQAESMLSLLR